MNFLGDKHDVGHRLRDIWNADRRMKGDDFKRDQLTNSECVLNFKAGIQLFFIETGKRSNRWNDVTIRMGKKLSIYVTQYWKTSLIAANLEIELLT